MQNKTYADAWADAGNCRARATILTTHMLIFTSQSEELDLSFRLTPPSSKLWCLLTNRSARAAHV
jgi:hypothetical protein